MIPTGAEAIDFLRGSAGMYPLYSSRRQAQFLFQQVLTTFVLPETAWYEMFVQHHCTLQAMEYSFKPPQEYPLVNLQRTIL